MRLHELPNGYVLTSDERLTQSTQLTIYDLKYKLGVDVGDIKETLPVVAHDFDFSSLSPEEQKEIGWFDVESIFNTLFPNYHLLKFTDLKDGFIEGFQKAQELLGGFTLEDMLGFYYWLKKSYGPTKPLEEAQIVHRTTPDKIVEMFIQSLSQPKSWSVEVEMEENQCDGCVAGYPIVDGVHKIPYPSGSIACQKEKYNKPKLTNGKAKILRIL
jgi:hypothetical protein